MHQTITGVLTAGYQVASGTSTRDLTFNADGGTIHLQIAEFKKRGLDFETYFGGPFVYGTLNVSVAPRQFHIGQPQHFFKGVRWTDKFDKPGQPPFVENFFLDPAELVFEGKTYKALIYLPDPSTKPGHYQLPTIVELIAQKIPGIVYGDTIELRYNPAAFTFTD